MSNLLQSIETQVGNFLTSLQESHAASTTKKTGASIQAIREAVQDIKQQILPSLLPQSKMKPIIRQYQLAVISLLNRVYAVQKNRLAPGELQRGRYMPNQLLIESVTEPLHQLLDHIQQYFPSEFDRQVQVPLQIKQEWELKSILMVRECNRYAEQFEISPPLLDIILLPFSSLLRSTQLCYNRFGYLQFYEQQLAWRLQYREEASIPAFYLPVQLNLNAPESQYYYRQSFTAAAAAIEDEHSKAAYFQLQIKMIGQVHVMAKTSFDPDFPALKEQLLHWLSEELYNCETSLPLIANPAANATTTKLKTSLPVAYLSVAVRLLIESGLLKHQNASDMMRLVARHVRTEKVENISETSLRNKAYNVDQSVIEGMKGIMLNMMNLLRGY